MKHRIARFSVLQTSKTVTLIYVLFSLLYTIIGILMLAFGPNYFKAQAIMFISMPLTIGIFGFITMAFLVAIYNLSAKITGGIEFEFESTGNPPPQPPEINFESGEEKPPKPKPEYDEKRYAPPGY